MNILFVHEVDWLNKVVFDIHLLAEALSLRGHRVFAIDYENVWSRDSRFDLGSLRTKEIGEISRVFSGASVRLRRPGFIKIPGLSRVSVALTHYLEVQRTIKEEDIDAIVLYSVPTSGLQTIHLARKFNIPIVFRSIDILNMLVPYPILRQVTRFLEKRVYSKVDIVLPNTPQYLRYVMNMGIAKSKVQRLSTPIDTKLFRPSVDCFEVRQKWRLDKSDQVIVFIGTLFEFSGLDIFIRQFPQVIEEIPEAKLLIVGDGPQRTKLERIINKLNLERQVIITGFQPYRTMPQYISLATLCVNTFLITKATRNTFPSKILQYLACGKATIATALPGITTLVSGESQGVVYVAEVANVAEEVISLLKSTERQQKLGQAGLDCIGHNYDHEEISHQLETILEKAIKEKK